MKVIVAGGRDFSDYQLLCRKLDAILSQQNAVQIVCGEARGADSLGRKYAEERGYTILSFPADWNRYGRSAGFRRNEQMAQVADALVAFWDGQSKGTANMIELMKNKPTRVVRY